MFNRKITDSDCFTEMPTSTQNLYFHLNMNADDDGFIGNAKKIMRNIGASEDDLRILLAKKYLISFDNYVFVVKHWWVHNTLMKDRYTETIYIEEKNMLEKEKNGAYVERIDSSVNGLLTDCYRLDNADIDIDIDISNIDNNKYIVDFFDSVWKLYPRKEGKSAISKSKMKELYKVGYERLSKAVMKYANEVQGRDKQYILMGSTFFNTRYKDYLEDDTDDVVDVVDVPVVEVVSKGGRQ